MLRLAELPESKRKETEQTDKHTFSAEILLSNKQNVSFSVSLFATRFSKRMFHF